MEIITFHPIALDSPDHIQPRGTMLDNSVNPEFNRLVLELFKFKPRVLDLGCAGGGLVQSLIDDGCIAIGLEGSDYSLRHQRAAWKEIPEHLFTCDIGYPFCLYHQDEVPFKFDVITMWELVEHLPTDRIDTLLKNIVEHLAPGGVVIGSTNDLHSVYEGVQHHLTIQPISWWYTNFAKHGLKRVVELEQLFNERNAWVRKVKSNFVLRLD